jgi:hypothetical protein
MKPGRLVFEAPSDALPESRHLKTQDKSGEEARKSKMLILMTGEAGFAGHHLLRRPQGYGQWGRCADVKSTKYEAKAADEFQPLDPWEYEACAKSTAKIEQKVQQPERTHGVVGARA